VKIANGSAYVCLWVSSHTANPLLYGFYADAVKKLCLLELNDKLENNLKKSTVPPIKMARYFTGNPIVPI